MAPEDSSIFMLIFRNLPTEIREIVGLSVTQVPLANACISFGATLSSFFCTKYNNYEQYILQGSKIGRLLFHSEKECGKCKVMALIADSDYIHTKLCGGQLNSHREILAQIGVWEGIFQ